MLQKKNNITIYLVGLLASLSFYLTGALPSVQAAGELMVAPTRVVFDSRRRSAQVNLVNTSTEEATFRIEFIQKRMTDTGNFVEIKEARPGDKYSDKMVRFSPRQVTLPPGQSQVIRLILRKPANLQPGEYRSHLLFRAIPSTTSSSVEAEKQNKTQLSVQLIPVLGISIPVIVRHGKTMANVAIDNVDYHTNEKPILSFSLKRTGNQSVFGDLTATFINNDGNEYVLSKANGVAVYTPNNIRYVKLPLQYPPGLKLHNGKIIVNYHQNAKDGGELLAQGEISIP